MKVSYIKLWTTLFFVVLTVWKIDAQSTSPSFVSGGKSSTKGGGNKDIKIVKSGEAWTLKSPLGVHEKSTIDTLQYNYQQQAIPSLVSSAYATTGNLGAPGQTQLYFNRLRISDFFFSDALRAWLPEQNTEKFYNVYVPMTLLSYNTGGNKRSVQDRLRATFAGNVNRRIGIGAKVDYLYAKGSYECQATKDFIFGFSGYYKGDRYQTQAYYNHYNMINKENGGIADDLYIIDPAQLQGGVPKIDPKNIPTLLTAAHSRVNGQEFYMNHAYNVGFWKQEVVNGTLTRDIYVPVTKFIWTFDYKSAHHMFLNTSSDDARKFWENTYLNLDKTDDNTRYWSIGNTIGIQMIEGFKKWAKFGLSVYATYEYKKYKQTDFEINQPQETDNNQLTPIPDGFAVKPENSQNMFWIGGQLLKQKGSILTYNANAKFGLIGDVVGDVEVSGGFETRFKLLGDTMLISAHGEFKNIEPSYLIKYYRSNHFVWDNNFSKTRNIMVGGELSIPWTKTILGVKFENVQNMIYFDNASLPRQEGENIRIFAATLNQKLKLGIWNWDNTITYQTTSNKTIMPLPALSVYSNMYLNFKAFKVLNVQFGVDCNYYTKYYAPNYQPATMIFHTQNEQQIGNYAFMNAYLTCKLKKVRFYLMFSHINQGWFSKKYFSMPHYPLNPRKFQIGLSIDFAN